ncbi:MAG: CDP-alcohol phosphatidyltransferase family protein [Anaerolineae bacterium]|nr:CDP-alcohol phosphatidyltransferase family protein [Anaerolineae bacterium]MCO5204444.1 CDP-alcohol phosphatidyltransferase family protein [Anaerolineae bacterium]
MTTSSSPKKHEKTTLTDLLRANTKFIIDPIVSMLARLHVSPDLLTLIGLLAHVLFAWLIINEQFLYAGIAIMIFSPLDALDGALSRKLGRVQNGFGAFFDSTLDRIAEVILFGGFVVYFTQLGTERGDWLTLAAYLALAGSIMVSYSRARAETLGFNCKVGLFSRVERYILIIILLLIGRPDWLVIILAVGTWLTVVQRGIHVWKQAQTRK